jgi:uncharacterized protein
MSGMPTCVVRAPGLGVQRTWEGNGVTERSEVRDGMRVDWDVPIAMDDGLVLRADVYRPNDEAQYPVLLSYGPYGKGLPFQVGYTSAWDIMVENYPEVAAGSTNKYQNWEVADPEKWVPHGYVCVRVDSRGAGRSPGVIDPWSPRETRDMYECIEWAGVQPWSSGKVGLAGISYYAINQWHVAASAPPHLAAMVPWEGAADFYRDMSHHGGIYCTFLENWFEVQVESVQYGLGERGERDPNSGLLVCGDETLSDETLADNRVDLGEQIRRHPLDDEYHRERSADWRRITVPFLSAGNWGGQGLHLRGNVEAFVHAASEQKWLEIHGREHWTEFYTDYGVDLQRRFFDHFLKGVDNGWDRTPPVILRVRTLDGFVDRAEHEWPLARTNWTRLYLDADSLTLSHTPPTGAASKAYQPFDDEVTFWMPPLETETELTGPMAARLHLSSSTEDADVFLVVRVFAPDGEEVLFQGAIDPKKPISQGWLRASHRRVDEAAGTAFQPRHPHDAVEPLEPGAITPLDIEIWPSSLVIPAGYRIALSVRGSDFDHGGEGSRLAHFRNEMRGCGPFIHVDDRARPPEIYGGDCALHTGPDHLSWVVLPFVPPQD